MSHAETQQEYIARLRATKPMREGFSSDEVFEESFGYWMGRQGKIIALYDQALAASEARPSKTDT